jgi:hypothetical protein
MTLRDIPLSSSLSDLSLTTVISSDVSTYKSDFDIDYFHVTKFDFDSEFDFFRYSHALLLNVVVFI